MFFVTIVTRNRLPRYTHSPHQRATPTQYYAHDTSAGALASRVGGLYKNPATSVAGFLGWWCTFCYLAAIGPPSTSLLNRISSAIRISSGDCSIVIAPFFTASV